MHFTPSWSLNVYVRPSSEIVHDVARSGTGLKFRSSRISMLNTLLATIFSTKFELVAPFRRGVADDADHHRIAVAGLGSSAPAAGAAATNAHTASAASAAPLDL